MAQRGRRGLPSSQRRCNISDGRASNTLGGTESIIKEETVYIGTFHSLDLFKDQPWRSNEKGDSYFLSVSQPKVTFPTMSMTPRIDIRKAA